MGFVRVGDVAARAGVSAGTVSNYFHNPTRVAEPTAERIRAAIDELGYVPNDAARSLRRGESRIIGHLSFEVANPYSADFVNAVDERARALDYVVLSASSAEDPARQTAYLDLFARHRVDGVILSPIGEVNAAAEFVVHRGIPLVLTDGADSDEWTSVSVDDQHAGFLAADHLLTLGHRRLCFAGNAFEIGIIERRLRGIRQALSRHPDATLEILDLGARTIAEGRRAGEELAARSSRDRPTGVVAVNDLVAIGVLHGVFSQLRVPEDVAIVGFDDIDFASEAVIPLTSIRRPVELFATRAVDALHEQIVSGDSVGSRRSTRLSPTLIVRDSTVSRR